MSIKKFGKIEEVNGVINITDFHFESSDSNNAVIEALKAIINRLEEEVEALETELHVVKLDS